MGTIIFLLAVIGLHLGCNKWLICLGAIIGIFVELIKGIARFFSVCKED